MKLFLHNRLYLYGMYPILLFCLIVGALVTACTPTNETLAPPTLMATAKPVNEVMSATPTATLRPTNTPNRPTWTPTPQPSPTILPVSILPPTPETYIVEAGDSLSAISEAQNVDWDTFLAINNIIDPVSYNDSLRPGDPLLLPPKPEADTQKATYRVQSGDTFSSIAEIFGVDVTLLMSANPMKESLYPGDELQIPRGIYIIREGDTLLQIALDHNVTVDELVEANKETYPQLLLNPNLIYPGWELKIPQQDEESANNVANAIDCAPSPPRTEVISHTVQTGEGMTCLVLKFGVSEPTLLNANPELWEEPDIPSGATLLIPPTNGALYTLTDKDIENDVTLVDIAWWYDVSELNSIVTWQGKDVPLPIQAGQQLFIPGEGLIANPYDVVVDKGLSPPVVVVDNPPSTGAISNTPVPGDTTQNPPAPIVSTSPGSRGIYYRWWDREHGKSSPGYCAYTAGSGWSGSLTWPVSGRTIYDEHGFRPGHDGLDINMPIGSPVYAAATGTVIWAGYSPYGGGFIVILAHGNEWRTAYLHLSSVSVSCGMTVSQGGLIGQSGDSATYYPHLHFEVVNGNTAQNPFQWLPNEAVYVPKP